LNGFVIEEKQHNKFFAQNLTTTGLCCPLVLIFAQYTKYDSCRVHGSATNTQPRQLVASTSCCTAEAVGVATRPARGVASRAGAASGLSVRAIPIQSIGIPATLWVDFPATL
jgi:hypothetical protein